MQNHSYENEFKLHENETACTTHIHMKRFVLVLKQRDKRTRKWLITFQHSNENGPCHSFFYTSKKLSQILRTDLTEYLQTSSNLNLLLKSYHLVELIPVFDWSSPNSAPVPSLVSFQAIFERFAATQSFNLVSIP